jgi:peptidyl-prolyl cis-trans isomerase D
MFDLFRSREKVVRIMLGAILVVVSLSMLTYLIPSYSSDTGSTDMVVAQIGKDVLTSQEVQRQMQAAMRGRQLPPEILPNFVPQMVEEMITTRALAYEAQRLGFQVTDRDLAEAIRQMVPSLFQDGKFVGKDAYAAMLAQQNLSIAQFESGLKRELLSTRMRNVAIEGTIVTQLEIEETYRKNNEKIEVEYVKLSPDAYRNEAQPTPEAMQDYFKANGASFQMPEKRNLVVLIADQAKVEQTVNPSDADLERMYSQNMNQFRTPERIKVRHILLKTTDKPAAEEPKIKAQAEDLLKQVRGGANFGDLAKKFSEDPGSASKGGEYDWIVRGQTVPEFEKAAFSLKPNQISDLVKTQYGYHIIQLLQHEDARLQPFSEAKSELAVQWKKQRVSELMEAISDKAQGALQKDPAHPEKVAGQFGMQLVRADGFEAGKPVPEVGTSADFDQSIIGLKKGEVSQPVALQGNKIALAEVTDVIPARPATFDEVKTQIHDKIVQNRLAQAVPTHAKELIEKTKAMGGDLAKAAKSMGLEMKTSKPVLRADTIEGVGSASYLQDAFLRPDGTLVGPVGIPDGAVVAKVIAHVQPDMSALATQRSTIRDQIKSQKARDRYMLFEAGVRDRLTKEGKLKIHQDVINRLIASLRG